MLKDFSWNMTGYIPKHSVEPSSNGISQYVAERIFQLEPEPPKVDSLNEYILSVLQEKDLKYFLFFLHHYELQLNKRIMILPRVRSMAWLYHNTKDAVSEFSKKYNCDLALAEEYLKVVRGIRNQQPFYVTDENGEETGEDVALDDTWNYTDILWNGIQAEKLQRAFEKLNYREQTLLEKRLAICMTCGRVGS